MVGPPGVPTTRRSLPPSLTIVGLIADSGRLPGSIALFSLCSSP